jgi:hypothetical protein
MFGQLPKELTVVHVGLTLLIIVKAIIALVDIERCNIMTRGVFSKRERRKSP